MKIKDIKTGQPYFYQRGTASRRQTVNGDGAAYVLSADVYLTPNNRDQQRSSATLGTYVPEAGYTGRYDGRFQSKGLLAVVVRTLVHEGDIPQEARDLVASMTLAQVAMLDFQIPPHITDELRERSCLVEVSLVRPQALLGEWDEVYAERKQAADAEFQRSLEQVEAQRSNADRWQDAMAQVDELLGEDVYFSTVASPTGDLLGEHRAVGIDVLERLIEMASFGRSYQPQPATGTYGERS